MHRMKCPKEVGRETSCNNPSWVSVQGRKKEKEQGRQYRREGNLGVMLSQPHPCQETQPAVQLLKTYWSKPYGTAEEGREINHLQNSADPVTDQSPSPRELVLLHCWVYSSAHSDNWRGKRLRLLMVWGRYGNESVGQNLWESLRFCHSSPLRLDSTAAIASPMVATTVAMPGQHHP